jgi:hypothetical protein
MTGKRVSTPKRKSDITHSVIAAATMDVVQKITYPALIIIEQEPLPLGSVAAAVSPAARHWVAGSGAIYLPA